MNIKTAIKISNIVGEIQKVDSLNEKVIDLLQFLYPEERPSSNTMFDIVMKVNAAFVEVLDELKDQLKKFK